MSDADLKPMSPEEAFQRGYIKGKGEPDPSDRDRLAERLFVASYQYAPFDSGNAENVARECRRSSDAFLRVRDEEHRRGE